MTVKEAVMARFVEILKESNALANRSGITPSTVYSMMDARRKGKPTILGFFQFHFTENPPPSEAEGRRRRFQYLNISQALVLHSRAGYNEAEPNLKAHGR